MASKEAKKAEKGLGNEGKEEAPNEEIKLLREQLKTIKRERDELNAKMKEKRDELKLAFKELDGLLAAAGKEKNKRDEANKKVSSLKAERDEANKQIAAINKKLAELRSRCKGGMPKKEYERLRREYERLNWKIQTSPMSKDKEAAMIKKLDELECQIKEYEAAMPLESEIVKIEGELKALRKRADSLHRSLLEASKEGELFHKSMHEAYKKVDEKKAKAKEIEKGFVEIKKCAEEKHKAFIEVLQKLEAIEEKEGIKIKKSKEAEKIKLKKEAKKKMADILSDLKSGKVITTEDLLLLQEME